MYVYFLLLASISLAQTQPIVVGPIDPQPIDLRDISGMVFTRPGCYLRLQCHGEGTGIQWRRFGSRSELSNSTSRFVVKSVSGNVWTAGLNFPFFTEGDRGAYTCEVLGSSYISTVVIQLDPALQIGTIPTINISQYRIGDVLTISCPFATCARSVTLQLYAGSDRIGDVINVPDKDLDLNIVQNFRLIVSSSTSRSYECRVNGSLRNGTAVDSRQPFNITGIPLPPPTTVQPTTPTGPTTGGAAKVAVQLLSMVLTVLVAALLSVRL